MERFLFRRTESAHVHATSDNSNPIIRGFETTQISGGYGLQRERVCAAIINLFWRFEAQSNYSGFPSMRYWRIELFSATVSQPEVRKPPLSK
jgi:hypothetical protein